MFDIGWAELLLLGVLAIIIVGPKDLPRMMRTMGQYTAKIRAAAREFQRSFDEMARESELDELRKQIADVKANNPISQVKDAMKHPLDSVGKAFQEPEKPLSGIPNEMLPDAAEAAAVASEPTPEPTPEVLIDEQTTPAAPTAAKDAAQ